MNNKNFLITIILISNNSEKTIKTSINNLLKQTFKAFELIIIDNCSTDKTNSYLDILPYKNYFKNLRIFRMIEKHNSSYLKNYGISMAEGDYITFLTTQDIISSTFIESLIKSLKTTRTQKYCPLIITNFSTKTDLTLTRNNFNLLSVGNLKELILVPDLFKYSQGKVYKLDSIKNFDLLFNEKLSEIESSFLFSLQYLLKSDEIIKTEYHAVISSIFINKNKILISTSENEFNIEQLLRIFIKLLETINCHKNYSFHLKLLKSLFINFIRLLCLSEIKNNYKLYTKHLKNLFNKIDELTNNSKLGKTTIDNINNLINIINNTKYSVFSLSQILEGESLSSITFSKFIMFLKDQNIKNALIIKDNTKIDKNFIEKMIIFSQSYNKNICILPIKEQKIRDEDNVIPQEYNQNICKYLSKESIKELFLDSKLNDFENSFIFIKNFNRLPKIDIIQSSLIKDKIL